MVARAWIGGPLRSYKAHKGGLRPDGRPVSYDPVNSPYVCDKCAKTGGIYEPKNGEGWLCGSCREER